jgi:hypothetical protein
MGRTKGARLYGREGGTGQSEKSGGKETSAELVRCRCRQKKQRQSGVEQEVRGALSSGSERKQQEPVSSRIGQTVSVNVAPLTERKVRSRTAMAKGRRLRGSMGGNLLWHMAPVKRERPAKPFGPPPVSDGFTVFEKAAHVGQETD